MAARSYLGAFTDLRSIASRHYAISHADFQGFFQAIPVLRVGFRRVLRRLISHVFLRSTQVFSGAVILPWTSERTKRRPSRLSTYNRPFRSLSSPDHLGFLSGSHATFTFVFRPERIGRQRARVRNRVCLGGVRRQERCTSIREHAEAFLRRTNTVSLRFTGRDMMYALRPRPRRRRVHSGYNATIR